MLFAHKMGMGNAMQICPRITRAFESRSLHERVHGFRANFSWRNSVSSRWKFALVNDDGMAGGIVSCLDPLWFLCKRFSLKDFGRLLPISMLQRALQTASFPSNKNISLEVRTFSDFLPISISRA